MPGTVNEAEGKEDEMTMTTTMTTGTNHPVVWFEVLGQDGASLQRYYADLFGWNIQVEGPLGYGAVDTRATGPAKGIPGGIASPYLSTRRWVTIYVAADDLEGTLARAQRLGGKVIMGPVQIPGGPALAVFEDPEGHAIGLVKDSNAPANQTA
jgi:predicted enzyme related to lactoylglutathione lyase